MPRIDLFLGQSQLLLHKEAISLHLGPAAIPQIRAAPATTLGWLLSKRLHLVIQILLLVDVQVLISLIDDCLSDATRRTTSPLLLVVVQCRIYPTLLARPYV